MPIKENHISLEEHKASVQRHNDIVDLLEQRIEREGGKCLKYVPWGKNNRTGEIDLLAFYPSGELAFYEVKCSENESKFFRAQGQYANFLIAHRQKDHEVLGYVYFGNGTRVRLPKKKPKRKYW